MDLLPALLLGANFLLFTLARAALRVHCSPDFSGLTAGEQAAAFVRGLRYDLSALSLLAGPPVILLLLPYSWARTPRWRKLWSWASFAMTALVAFALAGDIVYFGTVHRHAGMEVAAVGETLRAVLISAIRAYAFPLFLFGAAAGGLGWAWHRLLRRDRAPAARFGIQAGLVLTALVFFYYGERGTLWGKRLRVVHAYEGMPEAAAQLALNGPFCILHSLLHTRPVRADFYPAADALRETRACLYAPGESPSDPEYPLLRSRPGSGAARPNIVLIMLESWDAAAVDAHRRQMGLPPLGLTPCYDALASQGLLYSRFYATGQRSMDGMSALLCGFPILPGIPYLGQGLEQSTLSSLGRLGRREGYETWFIQSSERDSFRCDAIASCTGFDHYLGAEDIPAEAPASPRGPLEGACWDHEMFAEAGRRLTAAGRPFLAFLYTASTHHPYFWPEGRWKRREGDGLDARYANSMAYADWALGRFFEQARAGGWFDRTVFFITADHLGGAGFALSGDRPESKHHIPALLVAPGLAQGIDRRIGSQLDVMPTLAGIAGWDVRQAALGCSLLADPAAGRGALCVEGDLILRVEEGGCVVHNLSARVAGHASEGGDLGAVERRLLSITQTAYQLLRTNRLSR